MPSSPQSDGLVKEALIFETGDPADPVVLRSGASLPYVRLAYEVYGHMHAAKDNVILVFHALTGSQNVAGVTSAVPGVGERWTRDCHQGWWDGFVGPGKAVDTEKFCVVCANYLGGCYGSTGPSSTDPATGKPYGPRFPRITMSDIVDSQVRLLDHLGVRCLHAAIGSSIGGMLALNFATRYPDRVRIVVPVATAVQTSGLQKLHNFEQIFAIENDPNFRGGDYYGGPPPDKGLALARIISHKTFIHIDTLEQRARSEIVQPPDNIFSWYKLTRNLESYMFQQGQRFARRFDANTYLRIVDAWQQFDLLTATGNSSYPEVFNPCQHQQYLIFSIDSDVCFYPDDQANLKSLLDRCGVPAKHITVHSQKGHDSFLVEPDLYTPQLAYTLERW